MWLHRRCAARRRLLLARYTEGGRYYSSLHDSDCVRGKIVSHVADPISASIFTSSRHCSAALGSGAAVQHSRLHGDPYGLMTTTASHLRRRPRRAVAEEPSVLDSGRPEGRGSVRVKEALQSRAGAFVCLW